VAHGQRVCQGFENKHQMPINGDMWLRIGNIGKSLLF
jgi:hypothetical protein